MLVGEHEFQLEEDGTRLVLESDTSKLVFEGARVACVGLGRWIDWLAWDGWVGIDGLVGMGLAATIGCGGVSFAVGYVCRGWRNVL